MGSHAGAAGQRYSAHYKALEDRWGPFDAVARQYAAAVAALFVAFRASTELLQSAQRKRDRRRGNMPSVQAVERLRKRQGLGFATYDQALRRLEDLCAGHGGRAPSSVAEVLARRSRPTKPTPAPDEGAV